MRTILVTFAVAIAIAVAFGALAYGSGTSPGAEAAAPAPLHFLLRETMVPLDEGRKGPSNHERLVYRGTLLDQKTRTPRGTELGFCIVADAANQSRLVCQMMFTPSARRDLAFADQISAQTIFDDGQASKPQRTAITGGTGRYAGVRGEIVARPGPAGLVDLVFRFRR